MQNILNILVNVSIFLFNSILEIKYNIKRLIFKRKHNKLDTFVEEIYFINNYSHKIIEVDNQYVKNINEIMKYSTYIPLNNIVNSSSLNNKEKYLLEIRFKKHNKNYIINFPVQETNIFFPIYSINDLKHRNMNKFTDIDGNPELVELLNRYGGPLNDFYNSKDLGIPLKNIFDKENEQFPFRDHDYKLEDTFLNEYSIGPNGEYKPSKVLILKNTLDNTKITTNKENEQYIKNHYKKLKFDGRQFLKGIINWIFGK